MQKQSFNRDWVFYNTKNESKKSCIDLPHDAMLTEQRLPYIKNGSSSGFFPGGKYIYTKTLYCDKEYKDKVVILEFEGVYQKATIFCNNCFLGGKNYGYSNFFIDLTQQIQIGQSIEIKVVADNSQTPNSRWYTGSGIYRDVNLYIGNKNHIKPEGVKIVTKNINPAIIKVDVAFVCDEPIEIITEIIKDGAIIARATGSPCEIDIPDAKLWNAEHPELYKAHVILTCNGVIVDETIENFGIRKLECNAQQGLLVNQKSVKLRGGCIHHDNGPIGACSFESAEYRRVKIMKEVGFNAIRMAHNPASKALLNACDTLGMYVMNEAFDMWQKSKSDYDYALYFDADYEKDIESMVTTSFNHPSVIMYSIGNEIFDIGKPSGAPVSKQLSGLCRKLDTTRPTTNCFNLLAIRLGSWDVGAAKQGITKDDIVDPYNQAENSQLAGSTLVNFISTYLNQLTKFLGNPKKIDEIARESFDAVDVVGYNYAEFAYTKHNQWHPNRVIVASETYPAQLAKNWKLVETTTNLIGDFMWTAWDYLGETGLASPVYNQKKRSAMQPFPCISSDGGAIDMTGCITGQGHYTSVIWGKNEKPYIGVRPINHSGEKHFFGCWRSTDSVNSWTWNGQVGRKAEIEIFSSGTTVELLQDGKSLGKKRLAQFKALFFTTYRPGELVAISYDNAGKEIARSVLKTASNETILSIIPEKSSIDVNSCDITYIDVRITDNNGIVKMLEDRVVKVEVSGAGKLFAVGSGKSCTQETFTGDRYTTYQGRMIIVVRASGNKGDINVTCTASDLNSKSITLKAHL